MYVASHRVCLWFFGDVDITAHQCFMLAPSRLVMCPYCFGPGSAKKSVFVSSHDWRCACVCVWLRACRTCPRVQCAQESASFFNQRGSLPHLGQLRYGSSLCTFKARTVHSLTDYLTVSWTIYQQLQKQEKWFRGIFWQYFIVFYEKLEFVFVMSACDLDVKVQ